MAVFQAKFNKLDYFSTIVENSVEISAAANG